MTKISKNKHCKLLLLIVTMLIICTPVVAFLSFAQEEQVRNLTNQVAHSLINTMVDQNTSIEYKRTKIKEIIHDNFDVVWMSKFVLGRNYRHLSESQKEEYPRLYLNYLLNNYFPILSKYDADDSYEILQVQQIDQKDYEARIRLTTKKSETPLNLKYRIRQDNGDHKFLDMVVEGVSTLTSQRSEFSSIVQRSGIEALFKQLRKSKTQPTTTN